MKTKDKSNKDSVQEILEWADWLKKEVLRDMNNHSIGG